MPTPSLIRYNASRAQRSVLGGRIRSVDIQPRAIKAPSLKYSRPNGSTGECRAHVSFDVANGAVSVPHTLGYVPTQFSAMPATNAPGVAPPGVVYGDTPLKATKHSVQLRCSVAGTKADIIFR